MLARPSPHVVTNLVGCEGGVVLPGLVALGNDARDVVASDWSVDACATSVSRANTWRPTWAKVYPKVVETVVCQERGQTESLWVLSLQGVCCIGQGC